MALASSRCRRTQQRATCSSAVVLAHVILISAQVNSRAGVPAARGGDLRRVLRGAARRRRPWSARCADVWSGYVALRGVRAENETLRRELADAAGPAAGGAGARGPAARQLRAAARPARPAALPTTRPPRSSRRARPPTSGRVTIDKGAARRPAARHGGHRARRRRRPRRDAERLRAAKVQLLIDRNAAAGALVERSRAQGVVVGQRRRTRCGWSTCRDRRRAGRRHRRDLRASTGSTRRGSSSAGSSASSGAAAGSTRSSACGRRSISRARGGAGRARRRRPRARRPERAPVRAARVAPGASRSPWRCRRRWPVSSSGGRRRVDLVLVVVVYVALTGGAGDRAAGRRRVGRPGAGRPVRAGVIGIGGLAKTVVGFLAGIVGTQFIVARPLPRFVVFFAATVAARGDVHRAVRAAGPRALRRARTGRGRPGGGQRGRRRGAVPGWSSCCRASSSGAGPLRTDVGMRTDAAGARVRDRRTRGAQRSCGWLRSFESAPAEDRRKIAIRLARAPVRRDASCSRCSPSSFWYFQVVQHAKFEELAENNHQRTLALRAPRGVMFDRNGRVLVENRQLVQHLDRPRAHEGPRPDDPPAGGGDRHRRAARARDRRPPPARAGVPADRRSSRTPRSRRWRRSRRAASISSCPTSSSRRCRRGGTRPTRWRRTCSATSARSARRRSPEDGTCKSGDIVGQSGIEKTYNTLLMGEDGARRVVVNSVGREIRDARGGPAERGPARAADDRLRPAAGGRGRLQGARVQRARPSCSTRERRGARVHEPARRYDPNDFAAGIDRATWASLNTDTLRPLQNRAIQGRYSPGSTFKMVVATAALEEGHHHARLQGALRRRRDLLRPRLQVLAEAAATARVDLRHAIEQSCNVYFYTLGNMVGIDRIHKWATLLGLGVKSGIDLPNEVEGLVPSTEWKRAQDRREVVRGRDDLGRDRPGAGVGDADLAGRDDVDDRQRRHPRDAAPPQGGRRRQRVEAGAAAAAAVASDAEAGDGRGAARRPVAGRQRRRHGRPGADSRAATWSGRPARRR